MKVKILEDRIRHDGVEYLKDEQRTVSTDLGTYFCSNGWAEDVDGNVATAERDTNRKVLAPESTFHGHNAGEA